MFSNDIVKILELMLISRSAERREGILMRQGKSWSQIPCAGHEALMALSYQFRKSDYLFSYYRGAHLRLAKGIPIEQMAKDFMACAASSSGGRSVSVHCSSRELNVFPDAAVTGSQCLPATGVAWGQKLNQQDDLTACSIGDGSTRQGEFYEAVCFSVQEKLPMLFIVEDNGYAISTRTDTMSPLNLGIFDPEKITVVNGRDAYEVYEQGKLAIEKIRSGDGPVILWASVDRIGPHTLAEDHGRYRSEQELSGLVDPIVLLKDRLVKDGVIKADEIEQLELEVNARVDMAYKQAEQEAGPEPKQVYDYLGPVPSNNKKLLPLNSNVKKTTMLDAVNSVLSNALENIPNMLLIGQDIKDPKGGVFGLTRGLSSTFPDRVINAPLAEATIIGAGIGLAASGYKPVCEIQFIDFITPGFNQIAAHITSLQWRSMGKWTCPLVMYTTYGAYLPSGGLWHSQSNEGWWTHIPGLQVAIPSRPDDVAGLFQAAVNSNFPSLILLPKHLLRVSRDGCEFENIPFGKARVVASGRHVSVVSWGNCVELAEQAAAIKAKQGISVEIIDLRSLVPCDWQTVEDSLRKTGRLVVVHEDTYTSGFGAQVVAEMVSQMNRFELLWMAPQIVARKDVPMPYHPDLEKEVLPTVDDIVNAIEVVCSDLGSKEMKRAN